MSYIKRTWLNPEHSDSTGSVVAFHGEVTRWDGKKEEDAFLEIADCRNKIRLHLTNDDKLSDFINKMELLKNEIELFINYLNNEKTKM